MNSPHLGDTSGVHDTLRSCFWLGVHCDQQTPRPGIEIGGKGGRFGVVGLQHGPFRPSFPRHCADTAGAAAASTPHTRAELSKVITDGPRRMKDDMGILRR